MSNASSALVISRMQVSVALIYAELSKTTHKDGFGNEVTRFRNSDGTFASQVGSEFDSALSSKNISRIEKAIQDNDTSEESLKSLGLSDPEIKEVQQFKQGLLKSVDYLKKNREEVKKTVLAVVKATESFSTEKELSAFLAGYEKVPTPIQDALSSTTNLAEAALKAKQAHDQAMKNLEDSGVVGRLTAEAIDTSIFAALFFGPGVFVDVALGVDSMIILSKVVGFHTAFKGARKAITQYQPALDLTAEMASFIAGAITAAKIRAAYGKEKAKEIEGEIEKLASKMSKDMTGKELQKLLSEADLEKLFS